MTEVDADLYGSPDEAKVFLSYSRKDRERASGIADALRTRHFGVFRDTDDILPTEEWKTRLEELIEEADTIVFLLSPHSATSEVCAWEVEFADSLNKRIAPIVIDDIEPNLIPPLLARLNFIFCTPSDPFENAVDTLASALLSDVDWIREHTRLAGLARRWNNAGRPEHLLLRGQDIADAEGWRDGRPTEVPEIALSQAALIAESRRVSGRRQRNWIIGSLAAAACAAVLAVFSYVQSVEAERQRAAADRERDTAIENLRAAQVQQARFLAAEARVMIDKGDHSRALALALRAMPQSHPEGWPKIDDINEVRRAAVQALLGIWQDTVLRGHEDRVERAAFSSDGTRIVTASADNTARLWDATTGAEIAVLRGHESPVMSAAFSPDGTRVITIAFWVWDETARVWDAASGAEIAVLRGHEAHINSAAFSPDGARVVTASDDGTARLWDSASGGEIAVLTGHYSGGVRSAAFSPDGARIVTASDDRTARLWDATTGVGIAVLEGHYYHVMSAAFSPDGARIVIASDDRTARLWDATTGVGIAVLEGHEGSVDSAEFSPDGARIVTSSHDGTARLWDATTGAEIAVLRGHEDSVESAAFSSDGARIVTASDDGTARLWDATTGAEIAVLRGHEGPVRSAAFSPDGTSVVTASRDNTARLWGAASRAETAFLRGHERSLNSAAFSPDGARVVTGSNDRTARLWDAASGAEIVVLRGHGEQVWSATFSPNGASVVTASHDRTARLWDATTGAEILDLTVDESKVLSASAFRNGTRVVTASRDITTARIWPRVPDVNSIFARASNFVERFDPLTLRDKCQYYLADKGCEAFR